MTRLTIEIKKRICDNAIEQSPVTKALKDVKEKLSKLALDVYNDNATAEQIEEARKITARAEELPFYVGNYVFRADNCISCNFAGMRTYLNLGSEYDSYVLKTTPSYAAGHKFTKRFLDLEHKQDTLIKRKNDLKHEIMAVLNSCTTLKKLQQIWPESVNFLNGIETDITSTNLPAVVVEDLNKKLGISS